MSLLFILALSGTDNPESAAGWGILGLLYAVPFSIVATVKSFAKAKPEANVHDQLLKLNELREKNIISEEEFTKKKEILFANYQ
ncbi:SHOCT domain-containing protein [Cohnella pontilimi]|uniref:SHOCT domain-containing protein n=1 Tax=Cohnella pontilimi TaxID=2564100 RepID=UPI00145DD5D6|nr:SHOCT domain-containing protein [Cohnella pontilimi]